MGSRTKGVAVSRRARNALPSVRVGNIVASQAHSSSEVLWSGYKQIQKACLSDAMDVATAELILLVVGETEIPLRFARNPPEILAVLA